MGEANHMGRQDATGRSTQGSPSSRVRRASRPPENVSWVWLTVELLESDAWRSLSINARRIIDRLVIEHLHHGGAENGRLRVSFRQFEDFGASRNSISEAISELENHRLLVVRRTEGEKVR